LIGNFIKASQQSYLDTVPGSASYSYTNTTNLTVTPLFGRSTDSNFWVARQSYYTHTDLVNYTLKLPTSHGNLTIPQLGGWLTLNGRDSKIHVTDYDVAGTKIVYSTAEIFTWKKFADHNVLALYGGPGEHHEIAIASNGTVSIVNGTQFSISTKSVNETIVIAWDVSLSRGIVRADDLLIFLLGMQLQPCVTIIANQP
jgi:beta-galactosidase